MRKDLSNKHKLLTHVVFYSYATIDLSCWGESKCNNGENLIGTAGIWIGFGIVSFLYVVISIVIVITAAQASPNLTAGLAILFAFGLALIGIVKSAISAIYTAALYCYATDGEAPAGFESQQMNLAFAK